jgi:pimeloyl-ACP methyl ester carboxylesterase
MTAHQTTQRNNLSPAPHRTPAHPTNDAASVLAANPTMTLGQTVGAGHFLQLEVPEQVNPMIESFLAIIPGGTLAAQ